MDMIGKMTRTWIGRFILGGAVALTVLMALFFSCWYLYRACVTENPRFCVTEADFDLKIAGAEYFTAIPGRTLPGVKENDREKIWKAIVSNALGNEGFYKVNSTKSINIFAIDYEVLRRSISNYPTVRAAEIEMVLPNRLVVRITPRSPVAILANPGYVCDDDGMVMERNMEEIPQHSPLPMIVGMPQKAFRSGVPIDRDIRPALDLIYYVTKNPDLGIRLVKVNMKDPDHRGIMSMVFYYRQNEMSRERIYLAELPTDNRLHNKIEELVAILRNLNRADTPNGCNYIRLIFEPRPVLGRVPEIELRTL